MVEGTKAACGRMRYVLAGLHPQVWVCGRHPDLSFIDTGEPGRGQVDRDEVESVYTRVDRNDRKLGGWMMGTRVFVGNFPSSATEDQLRRPRVTHGEVASLSMVEAESPVRYRGLGGSDMPALIELEPVVSEPQRAMKQAAAAWPVWVNGTLPGVMTGKRPAARSVWENGTLPGIMAGKRPAPAPTGPTWSGFVGWREA